MIEFSNYELNMIDDGLSLYIEDSEKLKNDYEKSIIFYENKLIEQELVESKKINLKRVIQEIDVATKMKERIWEYLGL